MDRSPYAIAAPPFDSILRQAERNAERIAEGSSPWKRRSSFPSGDSMMKEKAEAEGYLRDASSRSLVGSETGIAIAVGGKESPA